MKNPLFEINRIVADAISDTLAAIFNSIFYLFSDPMFLKIAGISTVLMIGILLFEKKYLKNRHNIKNEKDVDQSNYVEKPSQANLKKPQGNWGCVPALVGLIFILGIVWFVTFIILKGSISYKEDTVRKKSSETKSISQVNMPYQANANSNDEPNLKTGVLQLDSGMVYFGELLNGKMDGKGKLTLSNGETYDGLWRNGQAFNGFGIVKLNEKSTYLGYVRNGVPNGHGKIQWHSGQYYEGSLMNGKPHGNGVFFDGTSSKSGYFEDGKMIKRP